jgi:hypothetical protein
VVNSHNELSVSVPKRTWRLSLARVNLVKYYLIAEIREPITRGFVIGPHKVETAVARNKKMESEQSIEKREQEPSSKPLVLIVDDDPIHHK